MNLLRRRWKGTAAYAPRQNSHHRKIEHMKVLITDDHQLFTAGLRLVLEKLSNATQVIEASTLEAAIEAVGQHPDLDLILLDLHLSHQQGNSGLRLIQHLEEQMLSIPVVVVSASRDENNMRAAQTAGALGYIPKSLPEDIMLEAIEHILDGGTWFPFNEEGLFINPIDITPISITPRQKQVLQLLAKGYANKQIAEALFISEPTVKSHVAALFDALNVTNRTQCVLEANKLGLLPDDEHL